MMIRAMKRAVESLPYSLALGYKQACSIKSIEPMG